MSENNIVIRKKEWSNYLIFYTYLFTYFTTIEHFYDIHILAWLFKYTLSSLILDQIHKHSFKISSHNFCFYIFIAEKLISHKNDVK